MHTQISGMHLTVAKYNVVCVSVCHGISLRPGNRRGANSTDSDSRWHAVYCSIQQPPPPPPFPLFRTGSSGSPWRCPLLAESKRQTASPGRNADRKTTCGGSKHGTDIRAQCGTGAEEAGPGTVRQAVATGGSGAAGLSGSREKILVNRVRSIVFGRSWTPLSHIPFASTTITVSYSTVYQTGL